MGFVLLVALTGCVGGPSNPAAVNPVTAKDPKMAQPAYWLAQPAVARIVSGNFDKLWGACRDAAFDRGFAIDRNDYRLGLLTTKPLVSKQLPEFWRNDAGSFTATMQSTLATVRRTIRFDVTRRDDGKYQAIPKVLVERYSQIEHRITSVVQYRDIFSLQRQDVDRIIDEGGPEMADYWYAIDRDRPLEKQLADSARRKLG